MSAAHVYLIWSNEHRGWWGPDERGYVRRLGDAGRYSRADALRICRNALGSATGVGMFAELPVRLEDVGEFLRGQVVHGELL
jgi:hypothetical protein